MIKIQLKKLFAFFQDNSPDLVIIYKVANNLEQKIFRS